MHTVPLGVAAVSAHKLGKLANMCSSTNPRALSIPNEVRHCGGKLASMSVEQRAAYRALSASLQTRASKMGAKIAGRIVSRELVASLAFKAALLLPTVWVFLAQHIHRWDGSGNSTNV